MTETSKKTTKTTKAPITDKEREQVIKALESTGLDEFMEYIRSPWRMLWPNFVAGIARGIGALVGAALVIALIGWLLTRLISLPLIGQSLEPYVREVQNEITKYTEATNYKNEFMEMQRLMREMNEHLKNIQAPQLPQDTP